MDYEELERRRTAEAEQQARANSYRAQRRSSETLTDLLVERSGIDPVLIRPGSVFRSPTLKPGTVVVRAMVEVEMTEAEVLSYMSDRIAPFLDAPVEPDDEPSLPIPPQPCLAATAYPRRLLRCELPIGHLGPHRFGDETWTAVGKR